MARRYSVDGVDTNTDNTTILYVAVQASTRFGIYDIVIGSKAAPADNAVSYEMQRFTAENATPGGTAKTPQALNPVDVAAASNAVSGPTGEPTYTANAILLEIAKNMRPTVRWVAVSEDAALIAPATTDNGIGMVADTPTTAYSEDGCFHFWE